MEGGEGLQEGPALPFSLQLVLCLCDFLSPFVPGSLSLSVFFLSRALSPFLSFSLSCSGSIYLTFSVSPPLSLFPGVIAELGHPKNRVWSEERTQGQRWPGLRVAR